MDDFLNYGMENLADALRASSTTKAAFRSIAEVFEEISELIANENRGMAGSLRELFVPLLATCTNRT